MSIATATITRVIVREAPNGNRTISVRINYVSTIGFGEHTTTAFFDETDSGIHHSTTTNGYMGTIAQPERFGDRLSEQWVRNYIAHTTD